MFSSKTKSLGLVAITAFFVTGCGGSSDAGFCGYDAYGDPIFCQVNQPPAPLPPVVASTLTFPVTQGLTNIATQNYSYIISATDSSGNIFSIDYASVPGTVTTFGQVQANTANVTQSYSENNSQLQTTTTTNYFIPAPYQFLGSESTLAGRSEVVNTWQAPPATGTVGQTFPSISATLYHDSTNTMVDGTLSETIGLSPDTANTALLCMVDTIQLTQAGVNDGLSNGTTSNCFRIDPSGNVLGLQMSTPVNGVTMLFY